MGQQYPDPRLDRRFEQLEQYVRWLRVNHQKVHTEALTWIVGGDLAPSLVIPPMFMSVLDGTSYTDIFDYKETKVLVGFKELHQGGSLGLELYYDAIDSNGDVSDSTLVSSRTYTAGEVNYGQPDLVNIVDGDMFRLVVVSSSGAHDLSFGATVLTSV